MHKMTPHVTPHRRGVQGHRDEEDPQA